MLRIWEVLTNELKREIDVYIENEVYILPITIQEHLYNIFLSILLDFFVESGYLSENRRGMLFKASEDNVFR